MKGATCLAAIVRDHLRYPSAMRSQPPNRLSLRAPLQRAGSLRLVLVVGLALVASLLGACGSDGGLNKADGDASSRNSKVDGPTGKSGVSGVTGTSGAGAAGTVEIDPVPSAGCASASGVEVPQERRERAAGGLDRWYFLVAPPTPSPSVPRPLIVDYHGYKEGAAVHLKMSAMSELAAGEQFILATPNGTGEAIHWKASALAEPSPDNIDLAFTDAMIAEITSEQCVDLARIYATGLSNGAMMSSLLACSRSQVFAAVAPVAGITVWKSCDSITPVPVISFHGTADGFLLYNGGVGDVDGILESNQPGQTPVTTVVPPTVLDGAGYPANAKACATRNGCSGRFVDEAVSPEVTHRVFDCPAGAEVEFYIVSGGGHAWPGSEFSQAIAPVVGHTTFDIDATQLIWSFFQRHARQLATPN